MASLDIFCHGIVNLSISINIFGYGGYVLVRWYESTTGFVKLSLERLGVFLLQGGLY